MNDDVAYALDSILEALQYFSDEPCAVCGEHGDALPCITCDKLVCGECGVDTRWCKECKSDVIKANPPIVE